MPRTEIRYLNIKKEYYAERRDEIMERNKKRHEENKERYYQNIKTKRQEHKHIKFHCECGSVVCFMDRHGHLKTKKHKTYMEEKINYK